MIGRLVQKADFERVLAAPIRSRSAHFAVHHIACVDTAAAKRDCAAGETELSTGPAPLCPQAVDDMPFGHWIGCVVPKRHARRAVTRSLLKRQIRNAFGLHAQHLAAGHWLVRLRQPFAAGQFVSASSQALRRAAREELDGLMTRAASAQPR